MKETLKQFLAQKGYLVSERGGENPFDVVYGLAMEFGVRITKNPELAEPEMLKIAADTIGRYAPPAFYEGFPETVRRMFPSELLLDQLCHYAKTYGLGDFSADGKRSIFEPDYNKTLFNESYAEKDFEILPEGEAVDKIKEYVEGVFSSTRPVNDTLVITAVEYVKEYDVDVKNVASSQNAIDMLLVSKDMQYVKFFTLQDVFKLVQRMCSSDTIKLTNQQRKLVTKVLDEKLKDDTDLDFVRNIGLCYEKHEFWKRLLHCIHYKPKAEIGKRFCSWMRDPKVNFSWMSQFEKLMKYHEWKEAADLLVRRKGNAALLRNLNYILSRCDKDEVGDVISCIDRARPIVLLQMMEQYANYSSASRIFKFAHLNKMKVHKETEDEAKRRKSVLSVDIRNQVTNKLNGLLRDALLGRVGKVYIEPGMEKIAVPMQLSTNQSGFGVLPTGSRLSLPDSKIVRAFTYWEKVNDIDLSCFGVDECWTKEEFSWRTMWNRQSKSIAFSGDITDGYDGGSEYFDINIEAIKDEHPTMKYIVFCDNVYSRTTFDKCVCTAGWMQRNEISSGEIFEPKTVTSSYKIDANATFCYMFAIDLESREVIWLNIADDQNTRVAGTVEMQWLEPYFSRTETMNLAKLFTITAENVVSSPEEADLIIGNKGWKDTNLIRPCDFEKVLAFLN